ncbi:MAG: DUF3726 domain-containing protein [Pseudomonadota bacterium]
MSYSLSEIAAQSLKATRGAGYPWGIAQEAGVATAVLSGYGLPGVAGLCRLLQIMAGPPWHQMQQHRPQVSARLHSSSFPVWQAQEGFLCSVLAGCAIADYANLIIKAGGLVMKSVYVPLLTAAAARVVAQVGQVGVTVTWEGAIIACSPRDLRHISGDDLLVDNVPEVSMTCRALEEEGLHKDVVAQAALTARDQINVQDKCWRRLEVFAERTYVPDSETSRLSGAGAGVQDND